MEDASKRTEYNGRNIFFDPYVHKYYMWDEGKKVYRVTIEAVKKYIDKIDGKPMDFMKHQRIIENMNNKIKSAGITKPAFVQLRCGGTIARVIYYVEGTRYYFYGNIVLRDFHVGGNNPTMYIYAQNRLVRLDCEHIEGEKGSYKVHQIIPMMDYCVYERGDQILAEYDKFRLEQYKNNINNSNK